MKILHVKSICCGEKIRKFGKNRRQCCSCKKTWRIRPKKRGRKKIRTSSNFAFKIFNTRMTVKQMARISGLSERKYQYRTKISLENLNTKKLFDYIPAKGTLVAVVDGLWVNSNGKRIVIYLCALKPVNSSIAYLIPPVLISGAETSKKWKDVFAGIPEQIKCRIKAMVCDGVTGLARQRDKGGLIFQRCQFHFLKVLERFKGTSNSNVKNKKMRLEVFNLIKESMNISNNNRFRIILKRLKKIFKNPKCPKYVGIHLRDFLVNHIDFRACIIYPNLDLPGTTSAMESLCGSIRERLFISKGFKTEGSLRRWVNGLILERRIITCRSKNQPN